ncbi:MAG: sodium-dependent transporter [Burkholderiaceae bacterium]
MSSRSQWGSRLGFILASAGSAVGLGAIWKFPYLAGANGGSAFILPYILIAFTVGLGLMMAEMALGRAGRGGIVETFRRIGGKPWAFGGFLAVLVGFLILSFYSVVGGWTVAYFFGAITGSGLSPDMSDLKASFGAFVGDGTKPIVFHAVFMLMTVLVVGTGVQSGIERLSKWLMPTLFVLMVALIVRGLTLPGAMAGVEYLFYPAWEKFTISALFDAMGFTFFSLSLGMGAMVIYGSYLDEKADLPSSAAWVVLLAVGTAILGGLMVLPPVFAFGMDPAAGPGLTFITMPAVFSQMPFGQAFAVMFYACLIVAALTSSVSLLEVVSSYFAEELKISRRTAAWGSAIAMFFTGIPCALSFGVMSEVKIFNRNFFDLFDYVSSNLLMPVGGILVAVLAGWVAWPTMALQFGAHNHGKHPGWLPMARIVIAVVAPLTVGVVMINGL